MKRGGRELDSVFSRSGFSPSLFIWSLMYSFKTVWSGHSGLVPGGYVQETGQGEEAIPGLKEILSLLGREDTHQKQRVYIQSLRQQRWQRAPRGERMNAARQWQGPFLNISSPYIL